MALGVAMLALHGCAGVQPQDGAARPPEIYVVRSGDTLFGIATRYHVDYRDIARWNRLGDGTLIYPGQELRLRGPLAGDAARPAPAAGDAAVAPPARWLWPTEGEVAYGFRQSPRTASGIVIAGRKGQPVLAAADGEVVYAGSGLAGYGQLVIVRHNAAWLSAYGHNDRLLVAEGVRVRGGQQIALMGEGAGLAAALHFEIRHDGEPVDPLAFLPARR